VNQDRLKQAFRDLQRLDPMDPYRRLYRAKLLAQSADLQHVDVRPYDSSLPDMAGIELRHGLPGLKVEVASGCTLQVGWDDGKPDQPFAALWSVGATALRVIVPATLIELGQEDPYNFAVKGTQQLARLQSAFGAIAGALLSLGQFGAAASVQLQSAALSSCLSTKVKIG
jgi:hypothetical protein